MTEAPLEHVVVVGFGLIGASVAKAAKARGAALVVTAVDHEDALRSESVQSIADRTLPAGDEAAVVQAAASADLVVLAAPVGVIETWAGALAPRCRLVTDCGSTKRSIARAAERAGARHFVPGHPMAGDSRSGALHARDDLFVDRSWILCAESCDAEDAARVEAFVRRLGARPVRMSVVDHDRAVALTSHVPQLLASALAVLAEERAATGAAGPAFASATRVAGGSEAMWRDILLSNADEIAAALRAVAARLEGVVEGLEQEPPDLDQALTLLARARRSRQG